MLLRPLSSTSTCLREFWQGPLRRHMLSTGKDKGNFSSNSYLGFKLNLTAIQKT